jgi:5-methylcytosine-specific restriction protein A
MRRGKRLAPRSEKGKAKAEAWRDVRMEVLARDRYTCQVGIPGKCKEAAGDVHHVRNRSQLGPDDPDNLISACRPCHTYVTEHPRVAKQMGWTVGVPLAE